MVEFRKWFPALAILALLLGSTAATAQTTGAFTCSTTAGVPPIVRAEGVAELLGDIVLNCTGGTPTPAGQLVPGVNINVFLNTQVTSRLLSGNLTESLLLIDEPTPAEQRACNPNTSPVICSLAGTGAGAQSTPAGPIAGGVNYRTGGVPNVFQGSLSPDGRFLSWAGVPIDPPGTAGVRTIRITNIRGNANQFGAAQIPIGTTLQGLGIQAFLTITSTQPIALPQPQVTIGLPYRGLLPVTVQASAPQFLQCNGSTATAGSPAFRVRFQEGFPSAFKRRNWVIGVGGEGGTTAIAGDPVANAAGTAINTTGLGYDADVALTPIPQNNPGQAVFTESGFYNPNLGGTYTSAGLATNGTRLIVRMSNIPTGATVWASIYENGATDSNSRVRLISTDAAGVGAFSTVSASTGTGVPTNVAAVPSNGVLVYEVMASDPLIAETIDIPFYVTFAAGGASLTTADNTPQVSGALAPIAADASRPAASSTLPVPRFADTATPGNAFTIVPCRTNILFPYVTTQLGFETGIAISNTSADLYSQNNRQTGTCTINYYGTGTGGATVPAETSALPVQPGETLLFTVGRGSDPNAARNWNLRGATGVPNYFGYVIAVCNFQYAHGFAFITDPQLRVAEGYLGLILDSPTGSRTTFFSEALNN